MASESKPVASYALAAASVALLAAFILSVLMIDKLHPTTLGSVAISALPVTAFTWFIVTAVRDIRQLDELQRRIQLEALAVAYPSAILLVFAVGFLERAGIVFPGFTNLRDVWPLTILPYWVGMAIATRRYR